MGRDKGILKGLAQEKSARCQCLFRVVPYSDISVVRSSINEIVCHIIIEFLSGKYLVDKSNIAFFTYE